MQWGGGIYSSRKVFSRNIPAPLPPAETTFANSISRIDKSSGISDHDSRICLDHRYDSYHIKDYYPQSDSKQSAFLQNNIRSFFGCSFEWAGQNSLAIYLLHGFFINLLLTSHSWSDAGVLGIPLLICNYLLTICLIVPVITALNSNIFLKKILFWK